MDIDLTGIYLGNDTPALMCKSGPNPRTRLDVYRKVKKSIWCLIFFSVLFFSVDAGADIYFIVNPSVPREHITKNTIKEIFLGKKLMWEDNQEIRFILIKQADFHSEFTIRYLNKTPSQFERYWRTILFSGKGQYPENARSVDDVISFVEKNKGAIGYISSKKDLRNRNVEIVNVLD